MRVSQSRERRKRGIVNFDSWKGSFYHRKWLFSGHRNDLWFSIKTSSYDEGKLRNRWTDRWYGQGHSPSGPAHLPSLSPCLPVGSWPPNSLYRSLWLDHLTLCLGLLSSSRTQIRCHLSPKDHPPPQLYCASITLGTYQVVSKLPTCPSISFTGLEIIHRTLRLRSGIQKESCFIWPALFGST